jgi:hypothetical protein
MSIYTQTTNFTALTTTHAVINGAAYDLEYGNVSTAIASKFDNAGGGYNGPFAMKTSGSGITLTVVGAASSYTMAIAGSNSAGNSLGLRIAAGTNASDTALIVYNQSNTTPYLTVVGDGGVLLGNAPTGGSQGNGTVNVSGSYSINGVNQFQTGSFTGTLTGMSAATTGTVFYRIVGNICTLFIKATIANTSNATTMTMTGLPPAVTPVTGWNVMTAVTDASTFGVAAQAQVQSTNSIQFGKASTAALANSLVYSGIGFTASGTKGLLADWQISYPLD